MRNKQGAKAATFIRERGGKANIYPALYQRWQGVRMPTREWSSLLRQQLFHGVRRLQSHCDGLFLRLEVGTVIHPDDPGGSASGASRKRSAA